MSNNPQIVIGVSATDSASAVLGNVDQKVQQSTGNIEQSGTKMASRWAIVKANMQENFSKIAVGAAGLAASVTGFATSFDTLEKAQLRARTTAFTLSEAQEKLEKLQKSGKATADEIADAQEKVAQAQDKARLAADAAHDTYTNFYANMPSQILSFGTAFTAMLSMTGVELNRATIAKGFNIVALKAHAIATALATGVLNAFRIASIMAFITNPVGAAIIGITTLVALLVFNVGGLRDMFVNLGKMIFEFLEKYFKPLADAIRWLIDGFSALGAGISDDTVPAIETASVATQDLTTQTQAAGEAVKQTAHEFEDYQTYLVRTTQDTIDTTNENYNYIQSLGQLDTVLGKTSQQVDLAAGYLRDLESEKRRQIEANFKLVADEKGLQEALKLTNEQIAKQADALRKLEEEKKKNKDKGKSESKFDLLERATGRKIGKNAYINERGNIVEPHAHGGTIFEEIFGIGRSGKMYSFGERGPETIVPAGQSAGGPAVHIHVHVGSQEVAEAIVGDLKNISVRNMRATTRRVIV